MNIIENSEKLLVSVIVTTRNEEKHIRNCLNSIRKQTYPQDSIEIIIVDNSSSDETANIAREFTDRVINMGPERSAQRNHGIKTARGEFILYLDADMILSEDVIMECVKKCEIEECDALYIPETIMGKGFIREIRNFERSFYNATCIDAVRFIRRRVFSTVGLFDLSLTGTEDWDLDRRIRQVSKVGIIRQPLYHDEREFSFLNYLRKKMYYYGTIEKYINKWGAKDAIIKKQVGIQYRLIGVFVENGKWKKLFNNPHLAIGLYIFKLTVALHFLGHRVSYSPSFN